MEQITGPAGETVHVDRKGGRRGEKGPFYIVYEDDRTTRWGYLCNNCNTVDTAVDSMGRVHCNECGNRTKPQEWDAAHE
jgi:hypothetical protein